MKHGEIREVSRPIHVAAAGSIRQVHANVSPHAQRIGFNEMALGDTFQNDDIPGHPGIFAAVHPIGFVVKSLDHRNHALVATNSGGSVFTFGWSVESPGIDLRLINYTQWDTRIEIFTGGISSAQTWEAWLEKEKATTLHMTPTSLPSLRPFYTVSVTVFGLISLGVEGFDLLD